MPVEREVANAVSKSMENAGWEQTNQLPDGEAPNPFRLEYEKGSERLNLIVHARRLTAQSGVGTDHNRPAGEYHAQMIFDGDKRGSGQRQHLRFADDAKTLLVGYFLPQDEYIFAAYNPAYHQDYAYSKSLQLRKQTL
jgi:hypothetical protein